MGTVFRLPVIQSQDLLHDLDRLKRQWNVRLMATVLGEGQFLTDVKPPARWALLFGNEAQGLSHGVLDLCDRRVTIPMQLGTDSLNIMVAAGIFLYHFTMR
jgi:tRNA G18 (ribose-2'-O)-methylase SpoU